VALPVEFVIAHSLSPKFHQGLNALKKLDVLFNETINVLGDLIRFQNLVGNSPADSHVGIDVMIIFINHACRALVKLMNGNLGTEST